VNGQHDKLATIVSRLLTTTLSRLPQNFKDHRDAPFFLQIPKYP